MADFVDYVFGGFGVRRPEGAEGKSNDRDGEPLFSLADLGPQNPRRYRLFLADQQLISSYRQFDVVNHLLWQILTRTLERTDEFLLIHAGSVVTPRGEGLLLPADSGSGKTTLVAGLLRAGFKFLSDEVGVIGYGTGILHPYPRALNLKEGSLALFQDLPPADEASRLAPRQRYLRAEEFAPSSMATPCRARFVIAPQYREGAATEVVPLSSAETLKLLWRNALNLSVHHARALPFLAEVVRSADGYLLISGNLHQAVRAVSEITGAPEDRRRALTGLTRKSL